MTDRDNNKIVGLVGYPGCGKDSLADVLEEKHSWARVAFADAIKEMLLAIDPVYGQGAASFTMRRISGEPWTPLEYLEHCKREGLHNTREKPQRLGKYMRDTEGEDYWVKKAFSMACIQSKGGEVWLRPDEPVIFTDIRYQNEFDAIKRSGGTIVGITRTGHGPVNDHESETNTILLLNQCDITLDNNDTIEALVARFITCV